MLKNRVAIPSDLDRLEERGKRNIMEFNRDKCKWLHMEMKKSPLRYRLGTPLQEDLRSCCSVEGTRGLGT